MNKNHTEKKIPFFSWAQFYNLYFLLVVGRTFNSSLMDESITYSKLEGNLEKQKDLQKKYRKEIFTVAKSYPEFNSVELIDEIGQLNLESPVTKDFYRNIKSWSVKPGWWKKTSSTSGSSGVSMNIIRSPRSFLNNQISFYRFFSQFGISRFDKNIYVGGARKKKNSFWESFKNKIISKITNTKKFVAADMISDDQFKEFIDTYEEFKPTYLYGFSSALLRISDYIERQKIILHWKPKLVHPNAEGISSPQRDKLKKIFKAPVVMIYGSAEGHMASECEHGVMHINMRSCEINTDKEGAAIVTFFETNNMPIVNYKIGDLVKIVDPKTKCKCGKHTSVITEIIGRLNDKIELPSGRILTHPDLNMLIQEIDSKKLIREYQILHYADTPAVEVRISANKEFSPKDFIDVLNARFTDIEFFYTNSKFSLLTNAKKPTILTVNEVPTLRKTYEDYKPYAEISESQNVLSHSNLLKLDWNESTRDFPPELKTLVLKELSEISLNNYPDLQASNLKSSISDWLKVDQNSLTVFNGSDAGIATICRLFLEDTDYVVTIEPTYANYRAIASRYTKLIHPYQQTYPFILNFKSFSDFLKSQKNHPKLVFFTNPNNPTGVEYPRELIIDLAKSFPRTCFVIDEAYAEFGDNPLSVENIPTNIIILRSFSKAFGLAGIRLGYSIASAELASKIALSKDNKEVDVFAQITGTVALKNPNYMYEYVKAVSKGRKILTKFFDEHGISYLSGKGNFVLFKVDDPFEIEQELKRKNIYIRNRTEVNNLEGYLRVTLGDELIMQKFISQLSKLL